MSRPTNVHPRTPSRDDTATKPCPVCQQRFTPTGRQTYCGDPCRKTAWRRRHQPPATTVAVPAAIPRRGLTVYQCPECQQRLAGQQRCPDCGVFARTAGLGGCCPHCDEPVTLEDLLPADAFHIITQPPTRRPARGAKSEENTSHRAQPSGARSEENSGASSG
jgi:hypothetical protein